VYVAVGGILGFWGLVLARSWRDSSKPRRVAVITGAVLLVLLVVQLVLNRLGVHLHPKTF
jgi:sulfite exporter TauE/SafE